MLELTEATEPFDEALDRTLWSLNSERVKWVTKVNQKRRKMPVQTAQVLEDLEVRRDGLRWEPTEEERAALERAMEGTCTRESRVRLTR